MPFDTDFITPDSVKITKTSGPFETVDYTMMVCIRYREKDPSWMSDDSLREHNRYTANQLRQSLRHLVNDVCSEDYITDKLNYLMFNDFDAELTIHSVPGYMRSPEPYCDDDD